MNFKGMSGGVSFDSIKPYNPSKMGNNNAFKNMDYSDVEEIDYSKYLDVDTTYVDTEDITDTKAASDPWYKVAADYAATAVGSFTFGVLEVVENIGDGLIMAGGALASGVVGLFDKELSEDIKEGTQKAIQYDWTEAGYTATMKAMGVNEDIAFGTVHDVAGGLGTAAGYIALSIVPGGAAVAATAGALGAAGSAAEMAFNQGATFEEALTVSAVAGVAGAVTGGVTNKIGAAAKGATTLAQVGKYALAGAAVSMTEPVINSTTEYLVYGQDIVDENGNKVYSNFGEYYLGSGGVLNTVIAGGVGGISTGLQGLGGYNSSRKSGNDILFVDDVPTEKLFDIDGSEPTVDLFATENLVDNSIEPTMDLIVTEKLFDYDVKETTVDSNFQRGAQPVRKIVFTDIDEIGPFTKQINALPENYSRYGNTGMPADFVIDDIETLKTIGSGDVSEGLKIIVADKGASSIEAVTAKGTVLQDYLASSKKLAGVTLTDEEIALRVRDVFSRVGLDGKDVLLTSDYKQIAEGISNGTISKPAWNFISDSQLAAELTCQKLFASDFDYWKNIDYNDEPAMKNFTCGGYDQMNEAMRNVDASFSGGNWISTLSNQLKNGQGFSERTMMYRGLSDLNWIADGSLRGKTGQELADSINELGGGIFTISDNAFESSTPVFGQGFTRRSIVEVTSCPEGNFGSYIGTNSSIDYEVEYLMQAGVGNKKVILGAECIGNQVFVYTELVE